MTTKEGLIQNILEFLNFPEKASLKDIRKFLWEKELCQFELIMGEDEKKYYSLFSKHEVQERQNHGLPVSLPLSQAAEPVDETKMHTLLTDPAPYRECVIFPELGPGGDDGAACKEAFYAVIHWFRTFMIGCSAGIMDVAVLNRFKATRKLIVEFRQTKDSMNPILSPIGIQGDDIDGPLERKILTSWIYPFIFTTSGGTLARIKRCRQCGRFFKGVRLHASFCTTKCRMSWNYANHA